MAIGRTEYLTRANTTDYNDSIANLESYLQDEYEMEKRVMESINKAKEANEA